MKITQNEIDKYNIIYSVTVTGKSNLFHFIFKMTITYRNICICLVFTASNYRQMCGTARTVETKEGCMPRHNRPFARHIDDDDEEDINAEHVRRWKICEMIHSSLLRISSTHFLRVVRFILICVTRIWFCCVCFAWLSSLPWREYCSRGLSINFKLSLGSGVYTSTCDNWPQPHKKDNFAWVQCAAKCTNKSTKICSHFAWMQCPTKCKINLFFSILYRNSERVSVLTFAANISVRLIIF